MKRFYNSRILLKKAKQKISKSHAYNTGIRDFNYIKFMKQIGNILFNQHG